MRMIQDDHLPTGDDPGRTVLPAAFDARASLQICGIICGVVTLVGLALWRHGGLGAVALAVSVFIIWVGRAAARIRPRIELDAHSLTARGVFLTRTIQADQIREVRYQFNGRSPDLRLVLAQGRSLVVPVSQVTGGHGVVLRWLAGAAPDATYDARAAEIRDAVARQRGVGA